MGLTVLLTNLFIASNSGSECVIESLADGLRAAGHQPVVYAPRLGPQARRMADRGHTLVDRLTGLGARVPDVIHAQHVLPSLVALAGFPQVPAVRVVHSAFGLLESPVPHPQFRRTVAVDEMVAERCRRAGVPPARLRIIPNAVDMARFRPRSPLPSRPRRALLLTKNHGHHAAVQAACQDAGIALETLGPATGRISDRLEHELPNYDLVFATARMALEAAAVGCAVVVADGRGFAGALTTANLDDWRRLNLGVALLTQPVTEALLASAIAAYDPADAARVAAQIRREAGLEDAINSYVALYHEAIAEGPPPAGASATGLAALLDETLPSFTMRPWRSMVREITFGAERARDPVVRGLRERLTADPPPSPDARAWLLAAARDSLAATLTRSADDELSAFDAEAAALLAEASGIGGAEG
jgi:Glycosyltransferase Family 4